MRVAVQTCCRCCDLHTGSLIIGICGILISIGAIIARTVGLESIEDMETREDLEIGIGYSYVFLVVNILLVYGTIKESRYFLLPWLVYTVLGLGVFTIICGLSIFVDFVAAIIATAICALFWYIWICVLSYYNEINPTNPPPASAYPSVAQVTTMTPTMVTYVPQAPMYVAPGPQVV